VFLNPNQHGQDVKTLSSRLLLLVFRSGHFELDK